MPDAGRRPTLVDVARRAGVSTALVSIVLRKASGASEESRRRVLEAAHQLGYRPDVRARQLRRARSGVIGVVFELQQPFHGDLVEDIYAAAEGAGYDIALSAVAPNRPESRAVESLLDERCEALILLGPRAPASELKRLAERLPLVVVARSVRASAVDTVRTSDHVGIRLAVDHLADLGHRHIAYVDGGRSPGAAERRRGFLAALDVLGLRYSGVVLPGSPHEEAGARAAGEILGRFSRVTGVLAFNDRCATGVLDAFLRAGEPVPQRFSLVGYDDSRLARLAHVNLTTIGQDPAHLARAAVARVVDRLDRREVRPRELVTEPRLIVRGTTGPPRT